MVVGASPISIGQLRRTATLLKNTPADTDSGTDEDSYTTVLTTRCSLEKSGGGFGIVEAGFDREKRYKMICRYQAAIVIDTDSLWQIGSDTYRIEDYTLLDDLPHFYQFILSKQ